MGLENRCWWLIDRLGGFATRDFAELRLVEKDRLLHRLLLTPRWYRFPFMAESDLQFGHLWTHPEARGMGLARMAMGEAHRRLIGTNRRVWYVVRADNLPSIALIERCGYRLIGRGHRTRPCGLLALGRFRIAA